MATLKEVADRAGVTVTTVSRMLNKPDMVSPRTAERIRQAMKALDYQPNEIAQSLSKKTSNFIGLIVPSARNAFFCKVVESTERYTSQFGYKLLLCVSKHERQKEIGYFNMLKANKVAGVIIASHTQDLSQSIRFDAPIISIDRTISPDIPVVCSDNYNGGRLAAEHLISRGCKRMAYFSGGKVFSDMGAVHRLQGFEDALRAHGVEPLVQRHSEDRFISMEYEDIISAFFAEYGDIDGAFCSNDIIAAEMLRYAAKKGIAVPEKLKIVGYDDVDIAALCSPSITSVHQPVDDICRYAVESIVNYHARPVPISTTFPVTLVQRESTADVRNE